MYSKLKNRVKHQIEGPGFERYIIGILRWGHREVSKRPELPLSVRLWAYRNGFPSESVPLFRLDKNDTDLYLSYWQKYMEADFINEKHEIIHDNKLHWYYIFYDPFSNQLPDLYGYIGKEELQSPAVAKGEFESLIEVVDTQGAAVVKSVGGAGGTSIHVLRKMTDGYEINGEKVAERAVRTLESELDEVIVSQFIEQAEYANKIFDGSANTIRIMTMVDPKTKKPYIGAAVHRFGLAGGAPVDNWSSGGVCSGVDINSGRLTKAIGYPEGEERPEFDNHPDTNAQITNVEIPAWDAICDGILKMASHVAPLTPYIGWDVLVTSSDGDFKVLESNSRTDIDVIQPHFALLEDDRNRRFYRHHGVTSFC